MTFTTFTSGTLAKSSEVNANFSNILQPMCDNALLNTTNIDVQDIVGSNFKIVDLFTDYNGSNNTIDSHTATYNVSNLYYQCKENGDASITNGDFETGDLTGWTSGGGGTHTESVVADANYEGAYTCKLLCSATYSESNISQSIDLTGINTLRFYYYYSGGEYAGDTLNVVINGDSTLIEIGSGAYKTIYNKDVTSYTGVNTVEFKLTRSSSVSPLSANIDGVVGYTTAPSYVNSTMTSAAVSVTQDLYNSAFIRLKLYEAIPSGATITGKISLDGGSTWSSEQNINTIFDISGLTDSGSLKVQMLLNTDGTVTPKVLGWSVLLFE